MNIAVYDNDKHIFAGEFDPNEGLSKYARLTLGQGDSRFTFYFCDCCGGVNTITHWCELPEAPKE